MNPKANPLPGEQGAQQTTGEASRFLIPDDLARFISHASAGDCCVLCGRCGGPAGPEGAWCDNCIRECREYTQWLDLQRDKREAA
jgi:hypothetical protein